MGWLVGWGFFLLFRDVAAQKLLEWQEWDTALSQWLQGFQFTWTKTPMSQADNEGGRRGGALRKVIGFGKLTFLNNRDSEAKLVSKESKEFHCPRT